MLPLPKWRAWLARRIEEFQRIREDDGPEAYVIVLFLLLSLGTVLVMLFTITLVSCIPDLG